MSFVGLHIHSDYSLLDGASELPELVDRAVELGMPAIALYEGILGEPRIPDYPVPQGHTADTYLEDVTWQGLLNRFNGCLCLRNYQH